MDVDERSRAIRFPIGKSRNGLEKAVAERGRLVLHPEDIKRLATCVQCGLCVASCPSGRWTPLNIRRIVRAIQLGVGDPTHDPALWECTTCYACQERCPREVPTCEVVRALRNHAFSKGLIDDEHLLIARTVVRTGHTIELDDDAREKRVSLGLPEVPPTVLDDPAALEEVRMLLSRVGFSHIIHDAFESKEGDN